MPSREQITASIINAIKDSGVQLRHPVTYNGTRWGMTPEDSANEYLKGVVSNASTRAQRLSGRFWGKTRLTGKAFNYDREQTGAIFDELNKIVITSGSGRQVQNLRRIGISTDILFNAEESLFPNGK